MHLLLWAEDSETELRSELAQAYPEAQAGPPNPSRLEAGFVISPGQRLPILSFARQLLPNAQAIRAESIRGWAVKIFEAVVGILPDDAPWALHIEPRYGVKTTHRIGARAWHSANRRGFDARKQSHDTPEQFGPDAEAGRHRCRLIREALIELMQKKRRHLLRNLRREPAPFTEKDSLVQLLLTTTDEGYLSVAPAPTPWEQRHLISPFPLGELEMASDKSAPSRAFAKLVEAERRLGRSIEEGQICVDLGASPGSWTYTAVCRGARTIAVDRSPLREDLMVNPQVEFRPGDAFGFKPSHPVDWLLCDVIAAPERTAELLLEWLQKGWCRHFVVTLKLKDASAVDVLGMLKGKLLPLTRELYLTRLCANKKEACAFGSAR